MEQGASVERAEQPGGELAERLAQLAEEVRRRCELPDRVDFEDAAAASELAALTVNGQGVIEQASAAACGMVGSAELVGRRVDDVLPSLSEHGVRLSAAQDTTGARLTCVERGLDGGQRLLILLPPAGRTEHDANEALTLSFRTTLHDLANVFATILGYAELALSKGAEGSIDRYLREVHAAGKRGQTLVESAQARIHGRPPPSE